MSQVSISKKINQQNQYFDLITSFHPTEKLVLRRHSHRYFLLFPFLLNHAVSRRFSVEVCSLVISWLIYLQFKRASLWHSGLRFKRSLAGTSESHYQVCDLEFFTGVVLEILKLSLICLCFSSNSGLYPGISRFVNYKSY